MLNYCREGAGGGAAKEEEGTAGGATRDGYLLGEDKYMQG